MDEMTQVKIDIESFSTVGDHELFRLTQNDSPKRTPESSSPPPKRIRGSMGSIIVGPVPDLDCRTVSIQTKTLVPCTKHKITMCHCGPKRSLANINDNEQCQCGIPPDFKLQRRGSITSAVPGPSGITPDNVNTCLSNKNKNVRTETYRKFSEEGKFSFSSLLHTGLRKTRI